jgi:hypothetical protein
MVDPGRGIGILNTDLALEPVGITEEDPQHLAEIGDEVISRTTGHQAIPDGLECLQRRGFDRQKVEPSSSEHRSLPIGLGVSLDLEHVELRPITDLDDREAWSLPSEQFRAVAHDLGVEDLLVEGVGLEASLVMTATWLRPLSSTPMSSGLRALISNSKGSWAKVGSRR